MKQLNTSSNSNTSSRTKRSSRNKPEPKIVDASSLFPQVGLKKGKLNLIEVDITQCEEINPACQQEEMTEEDYRESVEYILRPQQEPSITACSHEEQLFQKEKRDKIVRDLVKQLTPHIDKFDAIAVSGYSMALIGPIIADRLNKNIVLVRKDSEDRRSGHIVEGIHNQRCIFIDDLIDYGKTFDRVWTNVQSIGCTVVGYILYVHKFQSSFMDEYYPNVEYLRVI